MSKVNVTDHALVRWLERIEGLDIDYIREDIAEKVSDAIDRGYEQCVKGDAVFVLDTATKTVITVFQKRSARKAAKIGFDGQYGDRDDTELSYLDIEAAE